MDAGTLLLCDTRFLNKCKGIAAGEELGTEFRNKEMVAGQQIENWMGERLR